MACKALRATAPKSWSGGSTTRSPQGHTGTIGALLHPEFRGVIADGMPAGAGAHDGPTAMWDDGWAQIGRAFAAGPKPTEMTMLVDGRLLVSGRYHGHGRRGGGPLDAAYTHVFSFRDNRISGIEQVSDTARWRDAGSPFRTMTLEVADGVATVTLNRPETGNAFDVAMTDDILELSTRLSRDPDVRCVLLRAKGAFTVGGDMRFLGPQEAAERAATLHRMIGDYHVALERLASLDAPLVAAVSGSAGGGGLGLVCAADVAIAADDAAFALGYAALGMTSDGAQLLVPAAADRPAPRAADVPAQQAAHRRRGAGVGSGHRGRPRRPTSTPAPPRSPPGSPPDRPGRSPPCAGCCATATTTRLRDQLAAELREVDEIARTEDLSEGMSAFAARRRPELPRPIAPTSEAA